MDDNKVLVIGGGIGGMSTAIGLKRRGMLVQVFERMPEVSEIGTGTGIQAVVQQALEILGLGEPVRQIGGSPLQEHRMVAHSGRIMARIPRGGDAFVVHRGELLEVFKRELGDMGIVHTSAECVGYTQDGSGVTAQFTDGREERGIALVGADGVRSKIRQQLVGDGPPPYSGHIAWRGMFSYEHPTLPKDISEQVFGPATLFGLFPCDDRMFWWAIAVRPEDEADPPHQRKQDLRDTYRDFPEAVPQVIDATPDEQIFRGNLYHRIPVKTWTDGRVTLLGDAAHPTMPAFGQGAGMAMEDAAVLSRELASEGPEPTERAVRAALARYEERRIPRTTSIVNRARRMTKLSDLKNPVGMSLREAFFSWMPERQWARAYEHENQYHL